MSDQTKTMYFNDRAYTIKKFTPLVACFWAAKLFGSMIGVKDEQGFEDQLKSFLNMEFEEFKKLQKDCLQRVFYRLESGSHSIVNPDGFINDQTLTSVQVFSLTALSFIHSMSDFFAEAQLKALGDQIAEYFPQAGSEISSMPQSDQNTGDSMNSGMEHIQ